MYHERHNNKRADMSCSYGWAGTCWFRFLFGVFPQLRSFCYRHFCVFDVYFFLIFCKFICQYECNRLCGKTHLQSDLLCVECCVKPYTRSLPCCVESTLCSGVAGICCKRGKDWNYVMGHSLWTLGPGAAAARWLIVLWLMQYWSKELWVVDICIS